MSRRLLISIFLFYSWSLLADTNFCFVGDSGQGIKKSTQVALAMAKENCQTIIHAGDLFRPNGVRSISDPLWRSQFEIPYDSLIKSDAIFYVALGNHDYNHVGHISVEELHQQYAKLHKYYYFPHDNYFIRLQDSCIWEIETDIFNKAMANQLEKSMQETKKCSWKIVFGHHPMFSSGYHGNARQNLRDLLQPILQKYADIYLASHDHDLSDEGMVPHNSIHQFRQIISGGGGAPIRRVKSCRKTGCLFAKKTYGFVKINLNLKKASFTFINEQNQLLFESSLIKK